MRRREPQRLPRQGVVLPQTPKDRRDLGGLEQDLIEHPGAGRPLRARYRNFRPDAGSYLASLGGPRPYMTRLREIARLTAALEQELEAAREALEPTEWAAYVEAVDLDGINALIDRHNRWYPVEARLPMDPRTGDYALVNGAPYSKAPLDADWIRRRFPTDASVTAQSTPPSR